MPQNESFNQRMKLIKLKCKVAKLRSVQATKTLIQKTKAKEKQGDRGRKKCAASSKAWNSIALLALLFI